MNPLFSLNCVHIWNLNTASQPGQNEDPSSHHLWFPFSAKHLGNPLWMKVAALDLGHPLRFQPAPLWSVHGCQPDIQKTDENFSRKINNYLGERRLLHHPTTHLSVIESKHWYIPVFTSSYRWRKGNILLTLEIWLLIICLSSETFSGERDILAEGCLLSWMK